MFKEDGAIIETTSGLSGDNEEGMAACRDANSGFMVGSNSKAKKASKIKAQEFLTRVFKLNENIVSGDSKKKVNVRTASTSSGYNSSDR